MNALAGEVTFYNALTHNCTTTIRMHTRQLGDAPPFDWRLIVNGYGEGRRSGPRVLGPHP